MKKPQPTDLVLDRGKYIKQRRENKNMHCPMQISPKKPLIEKQIPEKYTKKNFLEKENTFMQ